VLNRIREALGKKDAADERTIHVLVVDDEEPIRRFVERVMRGAGYETSVASSGAEAVEIAAKLPALDAVVSDLMMPNMRGDELVRRLRQDRPQLKVLYLTGYSDALFKEKVTLWQDEAFLDKPCSIKALQEAVALLLSDVGRVSP